MIPCSDFHHSFRHHHRTLIVKLFPFQSLKRKRTFVVVTGKSGFDDTQLKVKVRNRFYKSNLSLTFDTEDLNLTQERLYEMLRYLDFVDPV